MVPLLVSQSVKCLTSAQVMISGSQERTQHWAAHSVGRSASPSAPPLTHALSLFQMNKSFKKYVKQRMVRIIIQFQPKKAKSKTKEKQIFLDSPLNHFQSLILIVCQETGLRVPVSSDKTIRPNSTASQITDQRLVIFRNGTRNKMENIMLHFLYKIIIMSHVGPYVWIWGRVRKKPQMK